MATLRETKQLWGECYFLKKNYEDSVKRIEDELREMAKIESNRIHEQTFVDEYNAGKPVGFFQLPSMMTKSYDMR